MSSVTINNLRKNVDSSNTEIQVLHAILMRLVIAIATLLVLLGCNKKKQQTTKAKEWTEDQKRQYFVDTFAVRYGSGQFEDDSANTFAHFFKTQYPDIKTRNYYDALPYAFEEEYIDTTTIDTSRHWFRIIVKPCFRLPYCLVVEKKYNKSVLTTKVTDGRGCNSTGNLVITMKFRFDDTLYDNITKRLVELNFWQLPFKEEGRGLDGETWAIESLEKGKYNFISRWVPQRGGDSISRELGKLGLRIRELSQLEKVLGAFGIKNGM